MTYFKIKKKPNILLFLYKLKKIQVFDKSKDMKKHHIIKLKHYIFSTNVPVDISPSPA